MRSHVVLVLALALGGCGSQIGVEDAFGCLVDTTEPVADAAAVPTGFTESVQEMLDRTVGSFAGTLDLADHTSDDLLFDVAQDGDPVVERRSWRSEGELGGEEPAIGVDCTDDVAIPVVVTLQSGTALAEQLPGTVHVDTAGKATFFASVDLDALTGDATPFGFDPATMARTTFQVSATADDAGWSGELSFQGESHPTSDGPDGSVSATNDPWGTFEAAPAPGG